MIVEATEGGIEKDYHYIDGQKQGEGLSAGFNKHWNDWADIRRMLEIATQYIHTWVGNDQIDEQSKEINLKSISVSKDGSNVFGINRDDGQCYQKIDGNWIRYGAEDKSFDNVSVSPNGQLVAATDCDGYVYVHNYGKWQLVEGRKLRDAVVDDGRNIWGAGQDEDKGVWHFTSSTHSWNKKDERSAETGRQLVFNQIFSSVPSDSVFQSNKGKHIWAYDDAKKKIYHLSVQIRYAKDEISLPRKSTSVSYITSNSIGDLWIVDDQQRLFHRSQNSNVWHYLRGNIGPIAAGKEGIAWISEDPSTDKTYMHYMKDGDEIIKEEVNSSPISIAMNDEEKVICLTDSEGQVWQTLLDEENKALVQSKGLDFQTGIFALSNTGIPLGSHLDGEKDTIVMGAIPIDSNAAHVRPGKYKIRVKKKPGLPSDMDNWTLGSSRLVATRHSGSSYVLVGEENWFNGRGTALWDIKPGEKAGTYRICTAAGGRDPANWEMSLGISSSLKLDHNTIRASMEKKHSWARDLMIIPGSQEDTYQIVFAGYPNDGLESGWSLCVFDRNVANSAFGAQKANRYLFPNINAATTYFRRPGYNQDAMDFALVPDFTELKDPEEAKTSSYVEIVVGKSEHWNDYRSVGMSSDGEHLWGIRQDGKLYYKQQVQKHWGIIPLEDVGDLTKLSVS